MRRQRRFKAAAVAMVLTGAVALSACADSADGSSGTSGDSDKTYKIGLLAALSGPATQTGQHQRDGAQSAVNAINAAGGVNGRDLELVVKDDGGNPNSAVSGFNDLIRDEELLGIFGSTYGSATLAFKPLLDRTKIPVIAPNTTHEVTNPPSEWLFRDIISAEIEVQAAIDAAKKAGIKKIAVLHTTDAYGSQGAKLIKEGDLEVVGSEEMPTDATDVTTQLAKLRAGNPEALFLWATTPSTGIAIKNAGQLGMNLPIVSGVASPTLGNLTAAAGSSALQHWINVGLIDPANPLPRQKDAIANIKKDFPAYEPDVYSVIGYGGIVLFAEALEAAGDDVDRSSLRDAIEKLDGVETVSGLYSYSAKNHDGTGIDSVVWLKADGDSFRRVDDPNTVIRP